MIGNSKIHERERGREKTRTWPSDVDREDGGWLYDEIILTLPLSLDIQKFHTLTCVPRCAAE